MNLPAAGQPLRRGDNLHPHLLHAEHGITVVMVTHDANIAHHCQRIIHIKDGEIVAEEKV